jgi:hypothetical protein
MGSEGLVNKDIVFRNGRNNPRPARREPDFIVSGIGPDTLLTVCMTGTTFELANGGKPLRLYPGFDPARKDAWP